MKLIFSTSDFTIQGFGYTGFPILLDKNMEVFEQGMEWLVYYCLKRGGVQSKRSWDTYGRDAYDYFSFIEANNLDWRIIHSRKDDRLLALYRDASMSQFNVGAATINRRLRLIIKFYQYACSRGWVSHLPYELQDVIVRKPKQFLAHTDTTGGHKMRPDVILKQPRTHIKVLNGEQVADLMKAIHNKTLYLMVRLALSTGLRKSEILTFPLRYVINPSNTSARSHIVVKLNPAEMITKGSVARSIHVPVSVMSALWDYVIHERFQTQAKAKTSADELFLTERGHAWSVESKSFNNQLERLSLPFAVHPHILRHTYATHTLRSLRQKKDLAFEPLLYVRDRMGHASINTTQLYLHFLNELEDDLINAYEQEIDAICEEITL